MSTMTNYTLSDDAWTLVYTAAADIEITLQNMSPSADILVRIGSGALVGDALTAAADFQYSRDHRRYAIKNTDKVFCRAVKGGAVVNVRA